MFKRPESTERKVSNITIVDSLPDCSALFRIGQKLAMKGNYAQAIEYYTQALGLEPTPSGYLARAQAHKMLGQYSKAIEDYTRALKLDQRYIKALIERGVLSRALGNIQQAFADLNLALVLEPYHSYALLSRAQSFRQARLWKDAFRDYSQLLELDSRNPCALMGRAEICMIQEQFGEAIEDYSIVMENHPKILAALRNRGKAYEAIQNYDEALNDYAKALEIQPNNSSIKKQIVAVLCKRGQIQNDLGRYSGALEDFTLALKFNPGHINALLGRAFAYFGEGNYSLAADSFKKLLDTNHPKLMSGIIYFLGRTYEKAGDAINAVNAYIALLRLQQMNLSTDSSFWPKNSSRTRIQRRAITFFQREQESQSILARYVESIANRIVEAYLDVYVSTNIDRHNQGNTESIHGQVEARVAFLKSTKRMQALIGARKVAVKSCLEQIFSDKRPTDLGKVFEQVENEVLAKIYARELKIDFSDPEGEDAAAFRLVVAGSIEESSNLSHS